MNQWKRISHDFKGSSTLGFWATGKRKLQSREIDVEDSVDRVTDSRKK